MEALVDDKPFCDHDTNCVISVQAFRPADSARALLWATMSASEPSVKRRRVQRSPSPSLKLDDDDNYEPYVPVAQRRQAKLAKLSALGSSSRDKSQEAREAEDERENEEQEEERRREKVRRGRALLVEAQEVHSKKASEGMRCSHLLACLLRRRPQMPKRQRQRRKKRQMHKY